MNNFDDKLVFSQVHLSSQNTKMLVRAALPLCAKQNKEAVFTADFYLENDH